MTHVKISKSLTFNTIKTMSSFDDVQGVVLDCGSRYTKAGFIGECFPRAVIPTVVGRIYDPGTSDGFPDVCAGVEAASHRGVTDVTWPVVGGLVKDWEEIEKLWYHIFYKELYVPPEQMKVLHSVHPLVTKKDREKMAEILFESFTVRSLNLVKSSVLVLYASGRTTGVVYESGAGNSFVTPVYEGFPLGHEPVSPHFTGEALSDRLWNMLPIVPNSFTSARDEHIEEIKSKYCYIAHNFKVESSKWAVSKDHVDYQLPDGQTISLGEERYLCPEIMFQPSLGGLNCRSVVDNIVHAIDGCDSDYKSLLYENVVVGGGSTLFPGLISRLCVELTKRLRTDSPMKVHVDDLPLKQTAVWVGGSALASLESLKSFWLPKEEYEEIGSDRIHYKFM